MTAPDRIESGRSRPGPVTRAISRAKVHEPARLYGYALVLVLITGAVMAGWVTEDWAHYLSSAAAVVLGIVPAIEAIRASSWSEAAHINSLRKLRSVQDVQIALGEAA